jgi:hypothetical protein
MAEIAEQLKARTMRFSLDVCALIQLLPAGEPGWTVQRQLAKAATSVAFNYRAGLLKSDELHRLLAGSREILAIMSSSYGTARCKERNKRDLAGIPGG